MLCLNATTAQSFCSIKTELARQQQLQLQVQLQVQQQQYQAALLKQQQQQRQVRENAATFG